MSNPRKLWSPKLPTLKESCPSCPFREDNDEEFLDVVNRLRKSKGEPSLEGLDGLMGVAFVRSNIKEETKFIGDFACHCTAYDEKMNPRPQVDRRQCPGAAAYYVKMGEQRERQKPPTGDQQ